MSHPTLKSLLTVTGAHGSEFPIYRPDYGCHHTLVCDGSAAQRESLLQGMIVSARRSGLVKTWLARTGLEETESLEMAAPDRDAANPDEAYRLIVRAQEVIAANLVHNGSVPWKDEDGHPQVGLDVAEPTVERPLVLLVLSIPLSAREIAERVADIATHGRKGGVALLVSAEDGSRASLGGAYGGSIRNNLALGNTIFL